MKEYLPIFKNELKNKLVSKYKLIGITSEIILSFDIFSKNSDLKPFVENMFEKNFRPYTYKSRTLLLSRVIRLISNSNKDELILYKSKLYKFISRLMVNE